MAKKPTTRAKQFPTPQKAESPIMNPYSPEGSMNLGAGLENSIQEKEMEFREAIKNGLGDAIGYGQFNPFNMPTASGFPGTEQISGTQTLFKNLRWYLVSNFRQLLSQLYVEIGLIQTICDLPVDDALRGGIDIHSKQLDEDEIKELQISLDRDKDIVNAGQAGKWNRLFGGAGLLILTDQDPETPLDLDAIDNDTELEFRPADLWELTWSEQNTEGYDPSTQAVSYDFYNYYGEKVHHTRVIKLTGLEAPSFIRPRLRGWGFSEVEKLVRSINQYLKSSDLTFEVLDEFKLDVYKIKNLVNTLLSPNGEQKIKGRIQLANWQKNYQNAIVMDSEDDFDHKQLSFAGLAEAQLGIRKQVASDMRMPLTKLFGTSENPGLGNGAQDDLENYNAMVESTVRDKIKHPILRLVEIKCKKLFGFIPDDLEIKFKPLRIMSALDEETVKTQKFTRLQQAQQSGLITTFEFREAVNKGNLLDITLDNAGDDLNSDDPEVEELVTEGANAQGGEQDESGIDDGQEVDENEAEESQEPNKKLSNEEEFDESKHPRAADGKFGKGGSSATPKKSKSKVESPSKNKLTKELTSAESEKDSIREALSKDKRNPELKAKFEEAFTRVQNLENQIAKSNMNPKALEAISATHDVENVLFHGSMSNKLTGFKSPFSDENLNENYGQIRGVGISLTPSVGYANQFTSKNGVGDKIGQVYKIVPEKNSIIDTHTDPLAIKKAASKLGVEEFLMKKYEGQPNVQLEQAIQAKNPNFSKKEVYDFMSKNGIKGFSVEGDSGKEFLMHDPSGLAIFNEAGELITANEKTENALTPFSPIDKMTRILSNSAAFDKASYEADGGDGWIDPRRAPLFDNPSNVDRGLWSKAEAASKAALGVVKWQFVVWMYKKLGGKFS